MAKRTHNRSLAVAFLLLICAALLHTTHPAIALADDALEAAADTPVETPVDTPVEATADTPVDAIAEQFGEAGPAADEAEELEEAIAAGEVEPILYDAISSIKPMAMSAEMIYFTKYESGGNYDSGLSYYDGYHAMGAFQFDNRYGLGTFLKLVYQYNPTRYACLKVIGDRYKWDVTGDTRKNGAFTPLGSDLNTAWHAAYRANQTEFSQLQNGYAYEEYYSSARRSLIALGIDIDARPDCIKGLIWGMTNLFGQGGGAAAIKQGYYWGANWFFKQANINNSMTDVQLATAICNSVIKNIKTRYPEQPEYWTGWINRYRSELTDCLGYLSKYSGNKSLVYRLYNTKTSEHLYTTNFIEYRDLPEITYGDWVQENVAWYAPKSSKTPVYRLYNKVSGDHHYTTNANEVEVLCSEYGWTKEGIAFYSDDAKAVPLYRLYNGRLQRGQHHYTANTNERDALVESYGWKDEAIGFYGVNAK